MFNCDVIVDDSPLMMVNTTKFGNDKHTYASVTTEMDAFAYLDSASDDPVIDDDEPLSSPPPTSPSSLTRSNSSPSMTSHAINSKPQLVHIRAPSRETVWRQGLPAVIQWNPLMSSVSEVRILLLQRGGAHKMVADHVENNGLFVYMRVPQGLASPDSDYSLRIMSMDGKHFVDSDSFTISP
ncbi:hypothetical protein H257_00294 [Aphanomyces astaci]|uniref:Uncharacterized protein n=1 Tax=Aphanomyces astaci TaxID=112090 RepID=W4HBY9_APHAT|nr:hypothetical protein H257_00294 [Aphanomyces astaci]ETV88799.1 hypothetical protein H257_00294 [Aphanomyces astaci]RHY89890.1 hypothetical protein DYB35_000269 [Aphanomyces astaci]RHZ27979.1 hypothetical protein DYB37_005132 [Aphanomyces astaci]RQM29037.1 hypothetical protein B5M09_003219 [Aphanomyces astaci]|eukprot:XP_009821199.1 hypothetical protein H257_00294 [Aphanomyces astaci]